MMVVPAVALEAVALEAVALEAVAVVALANQTIELQISPVWYFLPPLNSRVFYLRGRRKPQQTLGSPRLPLRGPSHFFCKVYF